MKRKIHCSFQRVGPTLFLLLSSLLSRAEEWPRSQVTLDEETQPEVMAALAAIQPARALPPVIPQEDDWNLFDGKELHVEVSYLYLDRTSAPSYLQSKADGNGFSLGAHYYLSRFFSAGMEYLNGGDGLDGVVTPTIRLRIPLDEASTALFVTGGVGVLYDDGDTRWEAHLGAGMEIRLLENLSFSMDFRAVESDGDRQFMVFRSGLSLVF